MKKSSKIVKRKPARPTHQIKVNIEDFRGTMFDQDGDDDYMICSSPVATMKIKQNPFRTHRRRSNSEMSKEVMSTASVTPITMSKPTLKNHSSKIFDTLKQSFDTRNSYFQDSYPSRKRSSKFVNPKSNYAYSSTKTMCESLEDFNSYVIRQRTLQSSETTSCLDSSSVMSDIKLDVDTYYARFSSPIVGSKNQKITATTSNKMIVRVSDYQTNTKNIRTERKNSDSFTDCVTTSKLNAMKRVRPHRLTVDLTNTPADSSQNSPIIIPRRMTMMTPNLTTSSSYNTLKRQETDGLKKLNKEIAEKQLLVSQFEQLIKEQGQVNLELTTQLTTIAMSQLC